VFLLPALVYMLATKDRSADSLKLLLLFSVGSALGIILLAPAIYQTFIGLTLRLVPVVIAMVVLLLGLFVPHLKIIAASHKWLLPGAGALAGLILIVVAGLGGYDPKHPRLDTIVYGLDADTAKATWASSDKKPDEWTKQFFSGDIQKGPLTIAFSKTSSRQFLQGVAPAEPLAAPHIELLGDNTESGVRTLRMRVTSFRQALGMSIFLDSATEVLGASVNGKRIDNKPASSSSGNRNQWDLRYYAVPREGIEMDLEIRSGAPLTLRVVDQTYGLPVALEKTWKVRPENIIAAPLPYNDSTFVSKSFTF
jgi:hypothetical protein